MVITHAKNGSPDMILTAFDRKFHEKKNEIPPRACRPPYMSNCDIKRKNGHNSGRRGSPMARIWNVPYYHTPNGFSMPKGPQL